MASPAAQAKAQALNAQLEGEARTAIDDIDKRYMRKIAKASHQCAVKCYDDAGITGSSDQLEACVRKCQNDHQQANAYVQNVSLLFICFFVRAIVVGQQRTLHSWLSVLLVHSLATLFLTSNLYFTILYRRYLNFRIA